MDKHQRGYEPLFCKVYENNRFVLMAWPALCFFKIQEILFSLQCFGFPCDLFPGYPDLSCMCCSLVSPSICCNCFQTGHDWFPPKHNLQAEFNSQQVRPFCRNVQNDSRSHPVPFNWYQCSYFKDKAAGM